MSFRRVAAIMKGMAALLLACVVTRHVAAGVDHDTNPPVSSIRVVGASSVTAVPDRVQVDVGMVTQAPQSQAAASQNADRLSAVLSQLRKALGPNTDIRTIGYSLTPNYQYHPNGGEPTITGYTATNVVRVTLDDLTRTGMVIDTATHAGANQVVSIQFTLRDQEAARSQALREAATKARAEADTLAAALGLRVVRILSVEESGPAVTPVRVFATARVVSAAPTPIEPGSIEVQANVTLTVEVNPTAR